MSNMQNKPPNLQFKDFDFSFCLQDKRKGLPLFPEKILLLNIQMNPEVNNNLVNKGASTVSTNQKGGHSTSNKVLTPIFPILNGSETNAKNPNSVGKCFTLLKLEMPPHVINQATFNSSLNSKRASTSEKKVTSLHSEAIQSNIVASLREKYKNIKKDRKIQYWKMLKKATFLMNAKNLKRKRSFQKLKSAKATTDRQKSSMLTEQNIFLSCRFCKRSFKSLEDHNSHVCKKSENSNGVLKYKCNLCSMVFKYKNFLDRHMKGHSRNNCKNCNAQFTKRKALCKHMKVAHNIIEPEKVYSCTYCAKTFMNRLSLHEHLKNHADGKFLCLKCGFMFSNEFFYIEHSKEHIRVPKFECKRCGRKFVRQQQYTQHMAYHDKYSCSSCNKTFATKKLLITHNQSVHGAQIVKKHICPICKKSFMRPIHLRKHLRMHNGEKPFICVQCEKNFSDERCLMKHFKSARHLQVVNDGKAVHLEKPFLCSVCGARFFRQQSLVRHIEMLHTPEEASLKCSQCDYSTKCKANLRRHEERHTDIKRYVCELCGASFRALATLREHHTFVHSEQRSFVCEKCNKAFKNKSTLLRHMRIHSEVRPYKCHCNRAYKRLSHLKRHMVSAHRMTVKKSYDSKHIQFSDLDTDSNTAVVLSIPEDATKSDQSISDCVDSFLKACEQNLLSSGLTQNSDNDVERPIFHLEEDSKENEKTEDIPCPDVHEFLNKREVSTCVEPEKSSLVSDPSCSLGLSESRDSVPMTEQHLNLSPEDYLSFSSSASPLNVMKNESAASVTPTQTLLQEPTPLPPENNTKLESSLNFQAQASNSLFPFSMRFEDFSTIPDSFLLDTDLASQPVEGSNKQLFEEPSDVLDLPLFATSQDSGLTDCADNLFDSSRESNAWASGRDGQLQDSIVGDKVSDFTNDLPSNSFLPCNGVFQNDSLLNCGLDANSFAPDDFFFLS